MIFTSSIIDGFKVLIGNCPIHIAMLLTQFLTIPIPTDDNGDRNDKATVLYVTIAANHVFLALTSFCTLFYQTDSHTLLSQLSIIALCVSLFVALEISS